MPDSHLCAPSKGAHFKVFAGAHLALQHRGFDVACPPSKAQDLLCSDKPSTADRSELRSQVWSAASNKQLAHSGTRG